jgi:hypothetical protein
LALASERVPDTNGDSPFEIISEIRQLNLIARNVKIFGIKSEKELDNEPEEP